MSSSDHPRGRTDQAHAVTTVGLPHRALAGRSHADRAKGEPTPSRAPIKSLHQNGRTVRGHNRGCRGRRARVPDAPAAGVDGGDTAALHTWALHCGVVAGPTGHSPANPGGRAGESVAVERPRSQLPPPARPRRDVIAIIGRGSVRAAAACYAHRHEVATPALPGPDAAGRRGGRGYTRGRRPGDGPTNAAVLHAPGPAPLPL